MSLSRQQRGKEQALALSALLGSGHMGYMRPPWAVGKKLAQSFRSQLCPWLQGDPELMCSHMCMCISMCMHMCLCEYMYVCVCMCECRADCPTLDPHMSAPRNLSSTGAPSSGTA